MKIIIGIILIGYFLYRLYKSFKKSILDTKEKEKSISIYSREIEENPKNCRAYFLRGIFYQGLRHYQLALDDFNKALDLNPDNKSFNYHNSSSTFDNKIILYNISNIKISKSKEIEKHISSFSREIEKDPIDPKFYYLRGSCYHNLYYFQLAIDDYSKAIDLNIDNKSYNFYNSEATFNNVTILQARSNAKLLIKDKIGAENDLKLSGQLIG